ncbi:hypothetical protein N7447_002485 [Penicillium robsamsonii]|uniref:uncharacterized protein n=1 Tax=Penicillium robsamsonii TaxID=1792511 RepID=UPI002548E9CD|nr:uncharacterized protein N7447_002485 [Penicillium robsamsonii]KAJ5836459.1 hypothetical protein N7447_002485 [Penicillium robsamsonii]
MDLLQSLKRDAKKIRKRKTPAISLWTRQENPLKSRHNPDLHPAMTKEMINLFRQKGNDYQTWINDPDDTNCQRQCTVSPSTLKLNELIQPSDDRNRWDAYFNAWVDAPEEIGDPRPLNLPIGMDYHQLYLRKLGIEKDGSVAWNKYHGRVVHTAIFADNNVRLDGPQ